MNRRKQPQAVTERTEPRSTGEVAAQSSLIGPANQSPGFSSQSSNNLQHSVELHIEELVLHGFAAGDCRHIGDSFGTEMNRLFTDNDVSPSLIQGGEIALLNDLEFDLAASASPESIGIQIARVIFRSFRHE